MCMKKIFKLLGGALIITTALGLCACDNGGSQANTTAENQLLICYDYGSYTGATKVFNADGKLIAQTDGNLYDDYTDDVWIVTDDFNNQTGIVIIKYQYSEDEFDQWGNPLIASNNYRFLDLQGNEVANTTIDNPCELYFKAPNGVNGDIIFFNFIEAEDNDGTARYEIYDKMGELILSEDLPTVIGQPESNHAYCYYNGKLLFINHQVWGEDWVTRELRCYVFERQENGDFAAKKPAKDYYSIERMYQEDGECTNYWQAMYYPTTGTEDSTEAYDVLNDDGEVVIEALDNIYQTGIGMIYAKKGNTNLLMDMDGKVIYSENLPEEEIESEEEIETEVETEPDTE